MRIERIVNLQGLKTAIEAAIILAPIERIVNLQGFKTPYIHNELVCEIERIVNLPTHIGGLTLFSENKRQNTTKISINKSK